MQLKSQTQYCSSLTKPIKANTARSCETRNCFTPESKEVGGNVTKKLWIKVARLLAIIVGVVLLLLLGVDPESLLFATKLLTGI